MEAKLVDLPSLYIHEHAVGALLLDILTACRADAAFKGFVWRYQEVMALGTELQVPCISAVTQNRRHDPPTTANLELVVGLEVLCFNNLNKGCCRMAQTFPY